MKVFSFLASFILITAILLSLGGCFKVDIEAPTTNEITQQETGFTTTPTGESTSATDVTQADTTALSDSQNPTTSAGEQPATQDSATQAPATAAPATQAPATAAPVSNDDPSGWSKAKIVETLGTAINKSKAYKGELDVDHAETFVAEVKSITGGQMFASIASRLIGLVAKPTNETLHYTNGSTTNSEGEVVPILLPKRNDFCLSPDGVAQATATKNDQGVLITITLVAEKVGVLDIPLYHSQCMGYLDVASLDVLKNFDSYDVTFTYPSSTITVQINQDGYVTSANYYIPVQFEGSASKGILSGEGVFDGSQTEVWTLHW